MTSLTLTAPAAVLPPAGRARLAGRVLSGMAVLFLGVDAAGKLLAPATMIAHSPPIGVPADPAFYRLLGAILAVCLALHLWRRTQVLGAVLLTGYLGGAVATQLIAGSPLFGFTLFPVYLGTVLWVGLGLRDARVRALAA